MNCHGGVEVEVFSPFLHVFVTLTTAQMRFSLQSLCSETCAQENNDIITMKKIIGVNPFQNQVITAKKRFRGGPNNHGLCHVLFIRAKIGSCDPIMPGRLTFLLWCNVTKRIRGVVTVVAATPPSPSFVLLHKNPQPVW